jgi:(R,R)-butanediol dehydrogenase/meso-butanediol dehydrogenase/diacetyl reductase
VRAAVYHGRQDLRLEDVPEPAAGPDDVKLRVLFAGICGSDLHEYYAGPVFTRVDEPHPLTGVTNPVVFGHELCGEVVEVGEGVDRVAVGDLVAVEPLETCGRCVYCRSGAYNLCPFRAVHGYTRRGGALSEFTVVKSAMAHRLPKGLTPEQGALVEPMTVGLHAAKRTLAEPGQTVAVHGAGPIGIGVLLALRARGVETIVSDPSPERRAAVAALGVGHVLDPREGEIAEAVLELTGGLGAAASVDAAGVPAALAAALESTAVDGTVVIVAVPLQPLELPVPLFRRREVRLTMSAGPCGDFPEAIEAMARGAYPLDGWVTRIAFDDVVREGIEPLHRQEKMKVLVDVAGASG